jgi:ribosomal protein S18 acetylase RimI-like enzyme
MKIHQIHKKDYRALRQILYYALYLPEGVVPYEKSVLDLPEISKYIEGWGRKGDFGVKMIDEEKTIGAIWGRLFSADNPGYGFVNDLTPEITMAMIPGYRNSGLGTFMYREFEKLAVSSGFQSLSLSVDKSNSAVRFYLREGYTIVNEEGTSYTMVKMIE